MGPHRAPCAQRIAEIAGLSLDQVSIKATTTEGLGFTGRREGIAAQAVASIRMGLRYDRQLLPDQLVEKAREVVEANRAAGRRIAVAESCTGGLVSAALTEIPGSSDVFEAGYVTYSNAAKISELKVSEEVVETFGAVSVATAWAMARGALRRPTPTSPSRSPASPALAAARRQKPVGTVVFARAERDADPAKIVADQKFFDEKTALRRAPSGGALRA